MNLENVFLFVVAIAVIVTVFAMFVINALAKAGDKRAQDWQAKYQDALQVIPFDRLDDFLLTFEARAKKTEESSIDDIIAALARQGYTLIKQDRVVSTNPDVVTSAPTTTVTISGEATAETLKKLYGDLPKTNMRYAGDDLDFGRITEE